MKSHVSIQIPTVQFLELVDFLRSNDDSRDPVEVVSIAIDYWLANADWKPELLCQVDNNIRGYQWKNLFLPNGTQIRMQYKGNYFYAKVEGDEIIYDGKSFSPGRLANTIAGTSRSAWRDLWIKRPEDKDWKPAEEYRLESKKLEKKLLQELEEL